LISIVIIVRNEEKNIIRLLNSIKIQEDYFKNIVIIDESSKDNTVKTIRKYKDKLPITLIYSKNLPIGVNRNLGGLIANSDILLFTEGNCFLKNGFLEEVESVFKDNKVVAFASCSMPMRESSIITSIYLFYDVLRWLLYKLRLGFSVSGSILAIRKTVFNEVKGFGLKYNDDGVLGRKIHDYCIKNRCKYVFSLNQDLAVVRSVNRFNTGFLESIGHYFYIITNFVPSLQKLLKNRMYWDEIKFRHEEHIT